jgi:mannose-6-phosphate isomerase-like protein (cupin superfamily)
LPGQRDAGRTGRADQADQCKSRHREARLALQSVVCRRSARQAPSPYKADNVYIVKRGEGTLTLEGETYVIRENDVIYIPAGMVHSLANHGEDVFEIFEIYAPAGRQFDVVLDE